MTLGFVSPTVAPVGVDLVVVTAQCSNLADGARVHAHGFGAVGSQLVHEGPVERLSPELARFTLPERMFVIPTFLEITITNPGTAPSNPLLIEISSPKLLGALPTSIPVGRDLDLTLICSEVYSNPQRQTGVRFDGVALERSRVTVQPEVGRIVARIPAAMATNVPHFVALFNPTTADPWFSPTLQVPASTPGTASLTGLTPAAAAVGRDDLTVTLSGSGLAPGATALAMGEALPTTVAGGAATVTVPRRLLQGLRLLPLTLANPGAPPSNPVTLEVIAPGFTSAPAVAAGQAAVVPIVVGGAYRFADGSRTTTARWDGVALAATVEPGGSRLMLQLPAALATTGSHSLTLSNPTDGAPVSSAPFAVVVGAPSPVLFLDSANPARIPIGYTTSVIVRGRNLPATADGYAVVRSGQAVPGVTVLAAEESFDRLSVTLSLRVDGRALPSADGVPPTQLQAAAFGKVASVPFGLDDAALRVPAGETFVRLRYGRTRAGADALIAVLSERRNAAGDPIESFIRLYRRRGEQVGSTIRGQGDGRHTDLLLVDFEGTGDDYLVAIVGTSRSAPELDCRVDVFRPNGAAAPALVLQQRLRNSTTFVPDFGEAVVVRRSAGGRQSNLLLVPQNSFIIEDRGVTPDVSQLFLLRFNNGALRSRLIEVRKTQATNSVVRTQSAVLRVGDQPRVVVVGKTHVFVVDGLSGDIAIGDIVRGADVPNPNPDGGDVQGRRYGQIRVAPVAGSPRLILAAHSQPTKLVTRASDRAGGCDGVALGCPCGAFGSYATLPLPPVGDQTLASLWSPRGPDQGYRFFAGATRKGFAKDKNQPLIRLQYVNGVDLHGGTPFQGITDLGDGLLSIVVGDAPLPPQRRSDDNRPCPGEYGDGTLTPRVVLLDAATGSTRATLSGATALDVLRRPGAPARLVLWGGLSNNTTAGYRAGKLQLATFEGGTLRVTHTLDDRHPALLEIDQLARPAEDVGVMSTTENHVMARPTIGTIDCFLSLRAGSPGGAQVLDAHAVADLTLQLEGASLDDAVAPYGGQRARLIGVVGGDDLPREPGGPVLPGDTLVVLEDDARTGGQRVRLFGVSSELPGTRRLLQVALA